MSLKGYIGIILDLGRLPSNGESNEKSDGNVNYGYRGGSPPPPCNESPSPNKNSVHCIYLCIHRCIHIYIYIPGKIVVRG